MTKKSGGRKSAGESLASPGVLAYAALCPVAPLRCAPGLHCLAYTAGSDYHSFAWKFSGVGTISTPSPDWTMVYRPFA